MTRSVSPIVLYTKVHVQCDQLATVVSRAIHKVEVIVTPLSAMGYTSVASVYPIVDSGVTNLIHDRRSYVDFTLEVEANVARCVQSSVSKPGVKRNSGL